MLQRESENQNEEEQLEELTRPRCKVKMTVMTKVMTLSVRSAGADPMPPLAKHFHADEFGSLFNIDFQSSSASWCFSVMFAHHMAGSDP